VARDFINKMTMKNEPIKSAAITIGIGVALGGEFARAIKKKIRKANQI